MPHAGGRQAETRRPRPPPQAAYRLMPFASREHAEHRETSVPRSREMLQSTQGDHRMPETAKLMTSATSRSFCLFVITQFDARPSQTEVKNFSDDFNVTMH